MTVSKATHSSPTHRSPVQSVSREAQPAKRPLRPTEPAPSPPISQGRRVVSPNIPITDLYVMKRKSLVESALSAFDNLRQSVLKIQDVTAEDVCIDLSSARASLERLSDILIHGCPLERRERPIDELLSRAYLYDNPQNSLVKELVGTLNQLGLNLSFDKIVKKSEELVKQSWVNFLQNAFAENTQENIVNGVVIFLVKVKDPVYRETVLKGLSGDQVTWVRSVKGWYEFMVSQKPIDRKLEAPEKAFIRHIVNAADELGITISKPDEPGGVYRTPSKRTRE